MPERYKRSGSVKKLSKRTPGGRLVIHYKKKKPGKARCSSCKKVLRGVPNRRASEMKKIPRTKKSPERPYAGVLCHKCLRERIIRGVKNMNAAEESRMKTAAEG